MINYDISLDMRKRPGRVPPRLDLRRGESQTQKITAALTDDGASYTPTYQSARLCILHADGTWARVSATVASSSAVATLTSAALNGAGRCRMAYFEFYSSNGYSETTEGFELVILGNVDTNGSEEAKNYDDELTQLYAKWLAYEEQAEADETARANAEAKRVSAETARADAEISRTQAESSRAQAETSRASAEIAREQAETTRANAEAKRVSAETSRVNAEAERVSEHAADQRASEEAASAALAAADAANKAAADAAALLPLGLYVDEDGDICQRDEED